MISFDSSEIDHWSDKPDAHHQLPELIRRLVMATVPMPSLLDMPKRQLGTAAGLGWLAHRRERKRMGSRQRLSLGA